MKDAKYEKTISNIQKLLRLSSNNPNPHEAALAASKAKELMDKYQISIDQVSRIERGEDIIVIDKYCSGIRYPRRWSMHLITNISDFFETHVIICAGTFSFIGLKTDVLLAKTMYKHISDGVRAAGEEYLERNRRNIFVQDRKQ